MGSVLLPISDKSEQSHLPRYSVGRSLLEWVVRISVREDYRSERLF